MALTIAALAALPGCAADNEVATTQASAGMRKGGDGRTGEYDVVENWWKAAPNLDANWGWGQAPKPGADPSKLIGRQLLLETN